MHETSRFEMADYCERSDIEHVFGKANVRKWADLDNDRDPTVIAARIDRGIKTAMARMNDRLRGGLYEIPLEKLDGVSDDEWLTVTDLAARLAGIWLYDNRAPQDHDPEAGRADLLTAHRAEAGWTLERIATGRLRIPAERLGVNVPGVTAITLEEETGGTS